MSPTLLSQDLIYDCVDNQHPWETRWCVPLAWFYRWARLQAGITTWARQVWTPAAKSVSWLLRDPPPSPTQSRSLWMAQEDSSAMPCDWRPEGGLQHVAHIAVDWGAGRPSWFLFSHLRYWGSGRLSQHRTALTRETGSVVHMELLSYLPKRSVLASLVQRVLLPQPSVSHSYEESSGATYHHHHLDGIPTNFVDYCKRSILVYGNFCIDFVFTYMYYYSF